MTASAFVQPPAAIARSICSASPRNARFTGIAEQSVARARAPDEVVRHVDGGQDPVQPRQHEVGEQQPERDREQRCPHQPTWKVSVKLR